MKRLIIVAVEPPPLEVIPDLIETRQPAIRSLEAMSLPVYSSPALFRHPGEILILGRTAAGDKVEKPELSNYQASRTQPGIFVLDPSQSPWMPVENLAEYAAHYLSEHGSSALYKGHYRYLPLSANQRQTSLMHWRGAVEHWYEEKASPIDYLSLASAPVDGVLEIGLNNYRLFEGQVSLQVLIKLIDPHSGRVLAKSASTAYNTTSLGQGLLEPDGSAYKVLLNQLGTKLIGKNFREVGLLQVTAR